MAGQSYKYQFFRDKSSSEEGALHDGICVDEKRSWLEIVLLYTHVISEKVCGRVCDMEMDGNSALLM